MARNVTMTAMILRARQYADMENSQFVTDTEFTSYLNDSLTELYDLLVSAYGEDYYVNPTPQTISVVAGTDKYALPSDYYKTVAVDYKISTTEKYPLRKFTLRDRNKRNAAYVSRYYYPEFKYRIFGNYLWLSPIPTGSHTLEHLYIQPFTAITGSSTFDGINGWEEYAVVDAAIKALRKEESDVSVLMAQKMDLRKRLEDMAQNRDVGEPAQATDVYATADEETYGYNRY